MELVFKLDDWISKRISLLKRDMYIQAYITNVLSKFKPNELVYTKRDSIVLKYLEARSTHNFATHQQIGDCVLFLGSIYPEFIKEHRTVVESMGQQSYYACYVMLNRQWKIYEELADELPMLMSEIAHLKIVSSV